MPSSPATQQQVLLEQSWWGFQSFSDKRSFLLSKHNKLAASRVDKEAAELAAL